MTMAREHRCRLPQTPCSNEVAVHKLSIVEKKDCHKSKSLFNALVCTSSRWVIVSLGRGSLLLEAFGVI